MFPCVDVSRCFGFGDMEAPVSVSLGAMGSLIRKLGFLVEDSEGDFGCRLRLLKGGKEGMNLLKEDLEEISSYLEDLAEVEDPPPTAKCWMKEVRELSYDIEDYIDSFVRPGHGANIKPRSVCRISHVKITRLPEKRQQLNRRKRVADMLQDFRIFVQEAIERYKRYQLDCCTFRRRFAPVGPMLPRTYEECASLIIDGRMIKFMELLANDSDQQLKVASVVGSGGMGKTTFVQMLYNKLKGQFDCRAFVQMTRKPDIKTVLRDMLTQVQRQQPYEDPENLDLLIGQIRKHLQDKRYLIVIDDVWSTSVWHIINHAFPGGSRCSRIVTTTEIEDVALACCCYHTEYVFEMRPLDDDLSRILLFTSLFCSESDFPQKFKEVSNKVVEICGVSPLATVSIASLIASHPVMLIDQWTYICDLLSSSLRISATSEGTRLVLNFSYNNLTDYLKTCLLYVNMYPEGCTVCKDDLVKQWVAEGFIGAANGQDVKKVAESYFHELIARRFLQPACIKYNDEVVSCTVHDVVRDIVAYKSAEENFIVAVDNYRKDVELSDKVRRLSLQFLNTEYAVAPGNIRKSEVRSLTFFGLFKCMPSVKEFKLLRVLNLQLSGHHDDDKIDLTGISELFQLRYLKVASDICIELPKQMRGLQYLETLDIGTKVTVVPWDIIHLPCLLHLHLPFQTNIMDWIGATISASEWNLGKLTNLQYLHLTCSIPAPGHMDRNVEALGSLLVGFGNLKTLALVLDSANKNDKVQSPSEVIVSWDGFTPPFLLERFEWLPRSCTFSRVPKWIGELGNLCILKIAVRELLRDGVRILGDLLGLTTLSLYVRIAPVERIVFNKAGFSVLRYFKFSCSSVPLLTFEADAMPNLQKLKLVFNSHMVDQHGTRPISIGRLSGLKHICAKVGIANSDAESVLMSVVTNHPRNPRIRLQLVDWNFYGGAGRSVVSKEKERIAGKQASGDSRFTHLLKESYEHIAGELDRALSCLNMS